MIKKDYLRKRARQLLENRHQEDAELYKKNLEELVEELQVYQIELEQQNDELQKTTGELENARQKYYDLFNNAPLGYVTIDDDFRIYEINTTLCHLLGEKPEKTKKHFTKYVAPSSQDDFYLHIKNTIQYPDERLSTIISLKSCGEEIPVKITSISLEDSFEQKSRLVRIAVMDVRKEKEQEIAIKKEQKIWKRSFESIKEGIFILDADYKVLQANQAFAHILNKSVDEVIGGKSYMLIHGKDEHDNCETCQAIQKTAYSTRSYYEEYLGK